MLFHLYNLGILFCDAPYFSLSSMTDVVPRLNLKAIGIVPNKANQHVAVASKLPAAPSVAAASIRSAVLQFPCLTSGSNHASASKPNTAPRPIQPPPQPVSQAPGRSTVLGVHMHVKTPRATPPSVPSNPIVHSASQSSVRIASARVPGGRSSLFS